MKLNNLIAAAGLVLASTASLATPSVTFLLDGPNGGDTFSDTFKITNNSATELITSVSITLKSGFLFNIADLSSSNQGRDFTQSLLNFADAPTLLASSQKPTQGGNSMRLDFANFYGTNDINNPCGVCAFEWSVDVDSANVFNANDTGTDLRVWGSDLIGSLIEVSFTGGTVLRGQFGALPGREHAAYWTASGTGTVTPPNGTPEPGSLALAGLALLGLGVARRAKRS